MEKKRTVSEQILREIIRRIVEVAQPETIVMFGSAARGEMGPHSDVDLLVVRSGVHRRKLAMAIYKHFSGVGCPVDVMVEARYPGLAEAVDGQEHQEALGLAEEVVHWVETRLAARQQG